MSYDNEPSWFMKFLGFIVFAYLVGSIGGAIALGISESYNKDFIYPTLIAIAILLSFVFIWYIEYNSNKSVSESRKEASECRVRESKAKREFEKKEKEFKEIENKYYAITKSSTPFKKVAEMFSDWESLCYADVAYFLRNKSHPAYKKADDVDKLKEKYRVAEASLKAMKYKYQFLLNTFPELKRYVDDEESLLHLGDYKDYEGFKAERDEVLDFVTSEEYKTMSETERNQLALDRFKKRRKTEWQVGMLYEMYIGHLLKLNHFSVIQYGIEKGLEDLGRDIIAKRIENDVLKIFIIQCKNWAKDRPVHENVVCQLYGTAMQYEFEHKNTFIQDTEVIPWLVITNELSDMAKKFAQKLGVLFSIRHMSYDFPMIKCNINNGEKIYHLPFDQQYYRTQIKLPGEFYALTVEEAVNAGFRRARRHFFEK